MQLVRKISRATVFGGKGDVLEIVMRDKTQAHPLYVVGGYCTGTRTGESITGEGDKKDVRPWTAMTGKFKAINAKGDAFYSGVCFLPQYVIDAITAQLVGDVDRVNFKMGVSAKYDEASATSYVFLTENLIDPTPEDELEKLVPGGVSLQIGAAAPAAQITDQTPPPPVVDAAQDKKKSK